ncbi:YqjK family protein [Thauera phenylacetica]|uniref:YqjK family protein n=1 Tax=Thauera phenylacetica TaxID=164400 RepID=UPI0039E34997
MDPRQIDLALRKQKLQMRADAQRTDITRRLAGIDGALDRVDSLRDHLAWAKDKIPVLSVALLVVLAAKPRLTLRLAKRAWVGWLLVRQARGGRLSALLPTAIPLLRGLLAIVKRRLEPAAGSGSAPPRRRRTG